MIWGVPFQIRNPNIHFHSIAFQKASKKPSVIKNLSGFFVISGTDRRTSFFEWNVKNISMICHLLIWHGTKMPGIPKEPLNQEVSFAIFAIFSWQQANVWQTFELFWTFQSKNDVRRSAPLQLWQAVKVWIDSTFEPLKV